MDIKVTSSAWQEGETIPKRYTCDGENISPPLDFASIPEETQSIALISDDPDAPAKVWVHWVIYNLPKDTSHLQENIPPQERLPNGALQGKNDSRTIGYTGPCPPGGIHRYYFKVYALNKMLDLRPSATKQELLDAMQGHILGQGTLMGRYSR
jgi:Raf kinase inhibitor-like YbhB/YbcL family protein